MSKSQSTKCSKCKEDKFANPKAYESRLKKYGSLEKIETEWMCRECKIITKGDEELARIEAEEKEEKEKAELNEPVLVKEE